MNKFFMIFLIIIIYSFFLINEKLYKINMSLDSNTIILNQYVNKEKLKDSNYIIDKIKKNINAYKNYNCGSCHLTKQKLLLPNDNLDFNTFKNIIRFGNQYMDPYEKEIISDSELKELYDKLYIEN